MLAAAAVHPGRGPEPAQPERAAERPARVAGLRGQVAEPVLQVRAAEPPGPAAALPAGGSTRPASSRLPYPPDRCGAQPDHEPALVRRTLRCVRSRRGDHSRPDLAVRFGGVAEFDLVVRRAAGHTVGGQRSGLLVDPGSGIGHEELAHVRRQAGRSLGVVGFGAGVKLLVQLAEHDAGVVGNRWGLARGGRAGLLAEQC